MADELLVDPGFEGDLAHWRSTDAQVAAHAPDTAIVFAGAQSMRVDFAAPGLAAIETKLSGLTIGETYRVEAWMLSPQDSGPIAPSIRINFDVIWAEAPGTWDSHPEDWDDYTMVSGGAKPLMEGVWTRRELVFIASRVEGMLQFYNAQPAVAGQSFYVDESTAAINVPRPPHVYCELAAEWTTVPVMNIIGEFFTDGMQSYREVSTFEPDGVTPITPATYTGLQADYASYATIMSNASEVTRVVRVDPDGTRSDLQYVMPIPIEYGGFRLIDIEAPLDVYFHYQVWVSGELYQTQDCIIPSYTVSHYVSPNCSPMLLSDPLVASQSMWVGLHSIDPLTHPGRRELFDIISRRYPVGLSDLRMTPRTSMRVITMTLEQRTDFLLLVGSGRVLLMRIPDPRYPEAHWYISVGDITEERIIHVDHRRPERRWTMEIALVERPHGLVTFDSNRIYDDVLNFEPDGVTPISPQTYQGVIFDYRDYSFVLTGSSQRISSVSSGDNLADSTGSWVLVR